MPGPRRVSWSHVTAWSDDTVHNISRGESRRQSHWGISADCASFFLSGIRVLIMDAGSFFLSVARLLNWLLVCPSKDLK